MPSDLKANLLLPLGILLAVVATIINVPLQLLAKFFRPLGRFIPDRLAHIGIFFCWIVLALQSYATSKPRGTSRKLWRTLFDSYAASKSPTTEIARLLN